MGQERLQEVVEVVRDPAGQPADRLHLLRLEELRLERHLLGLVAEARDEVDDGAAGIAHRCDARVRVEDPAVTAGPLHAAPPGFAAPGRVQYRSVELVQMCFGRKGPQVPPLRLRPGVAAFRLEGGVDVLDQAVRGGDHDALCRLLDRRGEAPALLLGAPALRDVANHRDQVVAIQADVAEGDLDREDRAILTPVLGFESGRTGPLQVPLICPGHGAAWGGESGVHVRNREREIFLSGVAVKLTTLSVHVEITPGLRVNDLDRVVGMVDKLAEQLERLLRLLALGDVVHGAHQQPRPTDPQLAHGVEHPEGLTPLATGQKLEVPHLLLRAKLRHEILASVGVRPHAELDRRTAQHLVARVAEHLQKAIVHLQEAAFTLRDEKVGVGSGHEQGPEAGLAFAQPLIRSLALERRRDRVAQPSELTDRLLGPGDVPRRGGQSDGGSNLAICACEEWYQQRRSHAIVLHPLPIGRGSGWQIRE